MLDRTPDPDFQRLRTALLRGEPDRVPLVELIVGGKVMSEFLGKPVDTHERYVDFHRLAGYDYVRVTPVNNLNPAERPPAEGVRSRPATERDKPRTWAPEGKGIITSWAEYEGHRWPKPEDADFRMVEECRRCLPEGMMLVGHQGDIFTQVWQLMGFETFCFALVEEPGLVEAMFVRVGESIFDMFRRLAEVPEVGALWYSDDIAYTEGLMVSPEVLRRYLFPWMRKIGDLARARDLPYLYHTDGRLWEVMEDLIACGVDALHPIEPKAMDIREVKRRYGDRLCVIGNIDLGYTLTRGTPNEVAAEVKQRLREVAPGGGYCLGSANTVPDYVPTENYVTMIRTALECGRYPITC